MWKGVGVPVPGPLVSQRQRHAIRVLRADLGRVGVGGFRRRLVRRGAAVGSAETTAAAPRDSAPAPVSAGSAASKAPQHATAPAAHAEPRSTPAGPAPHAHAPAPGLPPSTAVASPAEEQLRLRQQQQQEAAQQIVQRLVPPPAPAPVAPTKLQPRGGITAGGVALGVLLSLALQLAGRWVARQRWAQQVLELLDLRRSSGSAASTSTSNSLDGPGGDTLDGPDGDGWRWPGSARGGKGGGSNRWNGAEASGSGNGSLSSTGDGGPAALAAAAAATAAALAGAGPTGTGPGPGGASANGSGAGSGSGGPEKASASTQTSGGLADPGESVEWVNMCWRKVWRVYQRGLERWIMDLLQPLFDQIIKDGMVPRWLCRLRIVEFTLDHEAPYFSNMRRRNSRKDSDLNGVVDVRYTGGARMLLMLELGEGRWRFKVPVLVSDLDLECRLWLKLRLAPVCPWIGTISFAFVGPPNLKVQLSPYNRVRLMRVPVVQNYLRKLLTVDLPGLLVLPQRLEIAIPPSVTTIAEAAVGRDTIMRAVASAVLQADAVEAALLAALPLGPQTPAGGITLPEAFKGELTVTLVEARNLPVWGFPGQSNPYCRLVLGEQAVQSRREGDTSHPGRHRAPVWNQEFQFLVEDPDNQTLEMLVKDSHLTGRTEVGKASLKMADLIKAGHGADGGKAIMWVPLQPLASSYGITASDVPTGEVLLEVVYKPFDEDEHDSGYREAENYSKQASQQAPITDIRSAAAASSRAAVAASAAVSAIAMTKAAAARAAARAARAAQEAAAAAAAGAVKGASLMTGGGGQDAAGAGKGAEAKPLDPMALPPPPPLSASAVAAEAVVEAAAAEAAAKAAAAKKVGADEANRAARERLAAAILAAGDGAKTSIVGDNGDGGAAAAARLQAAAAAAGSLQRDLKALTEAAAAAAAEGYDGDDERGGGGDDDGGSAAGGGRGRGTMTVEARARALAAARSASGAGTVLLERPATEEVLAAPGGGGGGNGQIHYSGNGASGAAAGGDGRPPLPPANGSGPAGPADTTTSAQSGDHSGDAARPPTLESPPGDASSSSTTAAAAAATAPARPKAPALAPLQLQPSLPPSAMVPPPPSSQLRLLHQQLADVVEVGPDHPSHLVPPSHAHPGDGAAHGPPGGPSPSASSAASSHGPVLPPRPKAAAQAPAEKKEEGNWFASLAALLPRYGGDGGGLHSSGEEEDPKRSQAQQQAQQQQQAASADGAAAPPGGEKPWWQFWGDGKETPEQEAERRDREAREKEKREAREREKREAKEREAKAKADAAAAKAASGGQDKPWWQFWGDGGEGGGKDRDSKEARAKARARELARQGVSGPEDIPTEDESEADAGSLAKPVEAIYIPPDLPLEEIAAEVARLKEDNWRERTDHVSNLWMKAVERNDRKWLMLAAFLLSVAVGLLAVVAWRLEQLEHMQAVAPELTVLTMQAALAALEQATRDGGLL